MIKIKVGNNKQACVNEIPNDCPYCHKSIDPIIIGDNLSDEYLEIIYRCPSLDCKKAFIGSYYHDYGEYFNFSHCNIGDPTETTFSEEIQSISPSFIKIFNEASFAEQHNLTEICGVGYRKALEFLIKDYLIKNNPKKEDNIKKKFLGSCIKEDIIDAKIKKVAERAAWLGNDETHYVRIWAGQDLADLKKLIDLTLHWIEMEELTSSFETKMPKKK